MSSGDETPAQGRNCPVIRDVTCKSVLNRWPEGGYSLNCYVGCQHGCLYCYARFMQRFHEHPEPWGGFVDVKTNAVEALERQLRRATPGDVFVSSACDAWQPIEAERGLTRACCRLLLERGFHLSVLTKSALILRDLDVLSGGGVSVSVTVTTLEPDLARVWEPGAAAVGDRFRVLEEARRAGISTGIMFGPLLPFLYDDQDCMDALFERAAALNVDSISVDVLNPRPKVWDAVGVLLSAAYPDLRERYRRVLFVPAVREAYVRAVRERAVRAAARFGQSQRLRGCA